MSAIAIIPSRYGSTRFPGKPLYPLSGKPIIQHVYKRVNEAKLVTDVFVATDSRLIYDVVEGFGGKAIMTSKNHKSGTDRIAEAVLKLQDASAIDKRMWDTDIIVNVQGDEPLIQPEMVDDVIRLMEDKRASIGTLAKKIEDIGEITDPNSVKVVFNAEGFALYFSRSPIPYHRDDQELRVKSYGVKEKKLLTPNSKLQTPNFYFKHIGIYAYRRDVLLHFSKLPPTFLEKIEKLEQLRALENGFTVKVKETVLETIGVDTPADLERIEKCISLSS